MIRNDINKAILKPNIIMRVGYTISTLGFVYKMFSFKELINFYITNYKIKWFAWKFKHCKKFRENLKNQSKASPIVTETILTSVFLGKPLSLTDVYDKLTPEEKVNFIKIKEEIITKTIEKYNLTNKKDIEELRNMFNFDKEK